MLVADPSSALAFAHERARHFYADAAAQRLRRASGTRHAVAASLRSAADRLDAAPLAPRSA